MLGETGIAEDLHHLGVLEQGVRSEAFEPVATPFARQVLQKQSADTDPLVSIVHDEGHLGDVATWYTVVFGHSDQLAASLCDEGQVVGAFRFDEPRQLVLRQARVSSEVAQTHRFPGEAGVERLYLGDVGWRNRPDPRSSRRSKRRPSRRGT